MKNSVHRKELISEIRSLLRSQGMNTVFTTFLEITANSIASQTDPENAEKREQGYQEMVSTMSPKLLSSYARMLALLFLTAREYRDDPCDILGGIYEFFKLWHEKIHQLGSILREAEKVCRNSIGLHPGASSVRQTLPDHRCSGLLIKKYCSG